MDALHQLEIALILWVQSLGVWLASPMRLISMLGQEEFFLLVMPALYWSVDAGLGFRMAVMLLLGNELNFIGKLVCHSPRPYWIDSQVKGYAAETSFGMPSNHAETSAGLWGLMTTYVRQTWLRVLLVSVILLIGLSRIFLGVHFISDVVGGWLLGALSLWVFLKLERPIAAWLRQRTLIQMVILALLSSVLLLVLGLATQAAVRDVQVLDTWKQNAIAAQPGAEIDPLNLDQTFTLAGTWFGLMVGAAWLYHRQGGFQSTGTLRDRLLRYLIGGVGVLIFWFGLGKIFPRESDLLSYSLRYLRYTLVGLWVSALAPLLFERLGLTQIKQKQVTPLSSTENPL